MDWAQMALFLAGQGGKLIEAGRELWAAHGKDPKEFDEAVAEGRKEAADTIGKQRSRELDILGEPPERP